MKTALRPAFSLGMHAEIPHVRRLSWTTLGMLVSGLFVAGQAYGDPGAGPLRIHPTNPRYFSDGTGKAIYLTGSHTWGALCDSPQRKTPFDYTAYLDFLEKHNHNFFRLWSGYGVGSSPSPYERTGPGVATDSAPKADLDRLNPAYFERLRSRVKAAGDRGIYVAILLFDTDFARKQDLKVNLFHPSNNIQGLNGDTNGDELSAETFDGSVPRITAYQEAYVRSLIDAVNDLNNVLYEIGNEGDLSSVQWQYRFIDFIRKYEAERPKQHPIGMSAVYPIVRGGAWTPSNEALFNSAADWIAPGGNPSGGILYMDNPPAADGRKVIIADVDHIWQSDPKPKWYWKCFTRGLHPILMDHYDHPPPKGPSRWTVEQEPAMRRAMGYTLAVARKINLAAMTPQGELSSSGYCLADPGKEYLAYLPDGGKATVDLAVAAGELRTEWFNPTTGKWIAGERVRGGAKRQLTAPFPGDAVLYIESR